MKYFPLILALSLTISSTSNANDVSSKSYPFPIMGRKGESAKDRGLRATVLSALLTPIYINNKPSIFVGKTANIERSSNPQDPCNQFYQRSLKINYTFMNAYKMGYNQLSPKILVLMPGMGSSHKDDLFRSIAEVFFEKGFSILIVNSTYHQDFVVDTSRDGVIGDSLKDAQDLYCGIKRALPSRKQELLKLSNQIRKTKGMSQLKSSDVPVSVIGFSLGALNAAYVAKVAKSGWETDRNFRIRFSRTLLVNPPVDLQYGMDQITELGPSRLNNSIESFIKSAPNIVKFVLKESSLKLNFPQGMDREQVRKKLEHIAKTSKLLNTASLSEVKATIGFGLSRFVQSTASKVAMANGRNPKSSIIGFQQYLTQLAMPLLNCQESMEQFLNRNGLLSPANGMSEFLKHDNSIYLFHTTDDFLLRDRHSSKYSDIDVLKSVFPKNRTVIYPRGGHLGNIWVGQNQSDLIRALN